VVGVDLNPEKQERAREAARRRGLEARFEVRPGRAEDLREFPPASFDAVLCMELFDHLPDLAAALAAMRRVLREDGRFLFTYVPRESLYGMLGDVYRRLRAWLAPSDLMISRTYGFAEVEGALARSATTEAHYGGRALSPRRRASSARAAQRGDALAARRRGGRITARLPPRGAHVVGIARLAGASKSASRPT
jgi:SAM-dependent methyltransferase